MSFTEPQGEILPPIGGAVQVPDYAPAESRAQQQTRAEKSSFNPMASPATYVLVAVNCAVFLWMLLHGVSISNPTPGQLLHFGANNTQLVLSGEWYRLLTATFVHIGFIHLATNMWCLWNLGLLGEPLLGAWGLVATYMVTGVAGNLLSMGLNVAMGEDSIGAGASGAVFGIAGILIVLLSNKRLPIPWTELKRLRRSVIQFAVLNLIIGGATIFTNIIRIDNSAHVGGFVSGLVLGLPLVPQMTAGRARYLSRQKVVFAGAAFLLALLGYGIYRFR
ncbi:rhomboid family intramembrane serine protease [Granulicella arctica]|uniref:rhomboid family intramembrane serine protease n=1 Tax=Granulicella arctica TaxID=940613 RepID=UPI0021DF8983|nr:rhomboid family intramembrane serine protease [Granulicella arctica]